MDTIEKPAKAEPKPKRIMVDEEREVPITVPGSMVAIIFRPGENITNDPNKIAIARKFNIALRER